MSASLLRSRDLPERVVKLIGSDSELGNFILGRESPQGTGAEAARLLLRCIDGVARASASNWNSGSGNGSGSAGWGGHAASEWTYRSGVYYPARRQWRTHYGHAEPTRDYAYGPGGYGADNTSDYGSPEGKGNGSTNGHTDPQDWGRKFLRTNGACCYIDLNHLEVCTPEVLSARDFVAASRAMLVIARDAMRAASAALSPGERLVVLANNSDGHGQSYGSHLNFLISRGTWRRLFDRMYPDLFVLAAFQASSIVITGQGKVGSENGHEPVDYQLSQRADFIETLQGIQTTYNRPLVNTRDEAHCGHSWGSDRASSLNDRYARLHCIFFDHTLCQPATFLKVGTMQLVLAMLEAGQVDVGLILDDPVAAVHTWSRDPNLAARAPLADGRSLTAVELQWLFLERAKKFAENPGFGDYVPDSAAILELWEDTLSKLETGSIDSLRSRLDWVLKRDLIEVTLRDRPDLDWRSPEVKHLDLIYSSLDEREGLYWACEREGLVEHIVTHAEIHHLTRQPPTDTRAWTRAWLLRALASGSVQDVDWDHITFAASNASHGQAARTFQLYDPLGFTKEYLEARLQGSPLAVGNKRKDSKGNSKPTRRRRQT
jgi:proteasome accessory factor A